MPKLSEDVKALREWHQALSKSAFTGTDEFYGQVGRVLDAAEKMEGCLEHYADYNYTSFDTSCVPAQECLKEVRGE